MLQKAATTQEHPPAAEQKSSGPSMWILDPWRDLLFFIATPLLILPLLALALLQFSAEGIGLAVAALGAQGHHLPGMLRAYGDRELFNRFRVRFIVAPIFLLTFCFLMASSNLDGLVVLVLLWGFWHGLAQNYGFFRIYDGKVGARTPWRSRLDLAVCTVWFVGGFLYAPEKMATVLGVFYASGAPYFSMAEFQGIRLAWMVCAAGITSAFLVYTVVMWRRGQPCSYVKLMLMVSSISFWWVAMVYINPVILGVAAFEIFHDVQYLTIVWVYNRNRVDKGRPVGAFTRFLFRKSTLLLGLYLMLVFAYGYLALMDRLITSSEGFKAALYAFFAASGLLHFYFDGFIWKVRESTTSEGLGVAAGATNTKVKAKAKAAKVQGVQPWWVHGLKWSLFVIPALWLLSAQTHDKAKAVEQGQAVVAVVPSSAEAHFKLGMALEDLGEHGEAVEHYKETLRLKPRYAKAHQNLGISLAALNQHEEALENYREAMEIDPTLTGVHLAWGNSLIALGRVEEGIDHYKEFADLTPTAEVYNNLGNALAALGQLDKAGEYFQEAVRLNPQYTKAHINWGNALARHEDFAEAIPHYQQAVQINSRLPDAQHYWGIALIGDGKPDEAVRHFQAAVQMNPNYAEAHMYWGVALLAQNKPGEAAEHFRTALRLNPHLQVAAQYLQQLEASQQGGDATP